MLSEIKSEFCRIARNPIERFTSELVVGATAIAASWDPEIYSSAHSITLSAGLITLAVAAGDGLGQILNRRHQR